MMNVLLFFASVGDPCGPGHSIGYTHGDILGFPTWYHYLPGQMDGHGICSPTIGSISDVWLIVAAVIEILLRVAAILAVFMVIYGGINFITSQGEPDSTKRARDTIINALVGLAVAITSAVIVSFIANSVVS